MAPAVFVVPTDSQLYGDIHKLWNPGTILIEYYFGRLPMSSYLVQGTRTITWGAFALKPPLFGRGSIQTWGCRASAAMNGLVVVYLSVSTVGTLRW